MYGDNNPNENAPNGTNEATGAPATPAPNLQQNVALEQLPFLSDFDCRKVVDPRKPQNRTLSTDPYWWLVGDLHLLLDPLDWNRPIGLWDNEFNRANIFGRGFLFKNPQVERGHEFDFDPHADPFDEGPGKANLSYYIPIFS